MACDPADELQEALKAYIETVKNEPVPEEMFRLAIELNLLLEIAKSK